MSSAASMSRSVRCGDSSRFWNAPGEGSTGLNRDAPYILRSIKLGPRHNDWIPESLAEFVIDSETAALVSKQVDEAPKTILHCDDLRAYLRKSHLSRPSRRWPVIFQRCVPWNLVCGRELNATCRPIGNSEVSPWLEFGSFWQRF
jgi:hypothetical protein